MKYLLLFAMLMLLSCSLEEREARVTNVGHGVYYFKYIAGIEKICIELAKFKTEHKIISICPAGGATYIIICDEN